MKGEKRVRLDGPVAQIVSKHTLPEMYTVRQLFDTECIEDVQSAFECAATAERSFERVRPGMRIAVAAGSRGIDKYTERANGGNLFALCIVRGDILCDLTRYKVN